MLKKSKNLRKLRCHYWTLCELNLLDFDRQSEADIEDNVEQILQGTVELVNTNIPQDAAPDVPRNNLDELEWINQVAQTRYQQVISPDEQLNWLSSLDQRGLHWVFNELQAKHGDQITLDYLIKKGTVIRELDYYLYMNNSNVYNKKLFIQELKNSWEEYFHRADNFEWLSSGYFDVYTWAYNYFKQSGYESFWGLVPNANKYKEFLVLAYDQIRCQHKGHLLQKGFIKEIRAAFRVQKNRKEKAAKNLISRSYDFPEDTINKINSLSNKLNMTKSSILVDAIDMLYSKFESPDI